MTSNVYLYNYVWNQSKHGHKNKQLTIHTFKAPNCEKWSTHM
jgi:hypothetical protein